MPARKKRPVVHMPPDEGNIQPSDVTERTYPEGTPQDDDGAVAASAQVEIKRVRKVGALTADAARQNKITAVTLDRKSKGESVSWNNTDLLTAFDSIKTAFPTAVLIVTNLSTGASYKPVTASSFRTVEQLYMYLETIHKGQPQTVYEVVFKESGNWQIRAKCKITMPDSLSEPSVMHAQPQQQQQPYPWQLPAAPQQYMPPGYGGIPMQSSPYAAPAAAPPQPPPAPTMAAQPQIVIPPGTDPTLAAAIQALRDQNTSMQVQMAAMLGAHEESKRMLAQHQYAQAQAPQPIPVPQGVGAPPAAPGAANPSVFPVGQLRPGMMMLGYDLAGQPVFGFPGGLPGQLGQPPAPMQAAAPPPPPPPPPPPQQASPASNGFVGAIPPRSANPFEQMTDWVTQAAATVQTMHKARKMLDNAFPTGAQVAEPDDEEVPPPEPPSPRSPFAVTKIGEGPDPMVLLTDDEGKIDVGATVTGNLTKIPQFLHGIADGLQRINGSLNQIERSRPIVTQAHEVLPPVQQQPRSVVGPIPVRTP